MRYKARMHKFSHMFALIALTLTACAANVGASSEDPTGTATQAATAYNTPGPQADDAGVLGTHDNPFDLIVTMKFADATHQNNWAVDPNGVYGRFSMPLMLNGMLQFKWVACGAAGASC